MPKHEARKAKAPLGQNFLTDHSAVRAIVGALGNVSRSLVVEIGPGGGALTADLARAANKLLAIEFDRDLAAALTGQYASQPHVEVLNADVRRVNLSEAVAARRGDTQQAVLIGNLPYYITSDILLHLVEHATAFTTAVVMVQREVAERITAQPGTRDYGLLSVTLQMAAEAELLFTLPPESFQPPPQVHSAVVRLTMRPLYDQLRVDRAGFERFVRQCFAQKRKTLANNLKAAGYATEEIASAFAHTAVAPETRAESLSKETLAAFYKVFPGSVR